MKAEAADTNVHLRVKRQQRDVIDRAARAKGLNRSQFMIQVSYGAATDILLDENVVKVTDKEFNAIMDWLDGPKSEEELAGVKRLMETKLPWR